MNDETTDLIVNALTEVLSRPEVRSDLLRGLEVTEEDLDNYYQGVVEVVARNVAGFLWDEEHSPVRLCLMDRVNGNKETE